MIARKLFSLVAALAAAFFATLALPRAAHAAKVAVANCTNEFVTICAYEPADSFHYYPSSSKGLNPGTAGKVTCSDSSQCQIIVQAGNGDCQLGGTTGVAELIAHPMLGTQDLGNLAYQFVIDGNVGEFHQVGDTSHTFDDGAFCTAQNGSSCTNDTDCHSGACAQSTCVIDGPSRYFWMCSAEAGPVSIQAGDAYLSCDGKYGLFMQGDGNLVVYDELGNPTWSAHTAGIGSSASFRSDGELVVYSASDNVVWASPTGGHPNATFEMTEDGVVVIWSASHVALWISTSLL